MMKLSLKNRAQAFTLIELPVVLVTLALLAAILLTPRSRPAHHRTGINCLSNLKMIGLSFKCWALDNNDKLPMQVSVHDDRGTMELVNSGAAFPTSWSCPTN